MNEQEHMIKCSILPPGVVYIGEEASGNEFGIEFKKIPLDYPQEPEDTDCMIPLQQEGEGAAIYIKADFGEGVNDLCTMEQASGLTFTTLSGEGWEMGWSNTNQCFIVRLPADFKFPEEYGAAFRSNGFYTQAKSGTATLKAYFVNFPDVITKVAAVDIYKRYPIEFEYFKAEPQTVSIGEKTVLSWRVLNASKCHILGIGEVEVEGSREVTVTSPKVFRLTAENDMGKSDWTESQIFVKKPEINLKADRKYYHPGEQITLSWESTSAEAVRISPFPGEVGKSGSVEVTPEGDEIFTALAHGYDGTKQYDATDCVTLSSTPWKREGVVSGWEPALEQLNADRRIWSYRGSHYLFSGNTLYVSSDTLAWNTLEVYQIPEDMKLERYATIVSGDTFLILGLTKKNSASVHAAVYDFVKKTWTTVEIIPTASNVGGILSKTDDKPYYAKLKKSLVMFYTQTNPVLNLWGNVFFLEAGQSDAFDLAALKDLFYVAVRDSNSHLLSFYSIHPGDAQWRREGELEAPVDGWFCMIATRGELFLLTQNNMLSVDSFQSVSKFHPPLDSDYLSWSSAGDSTPFVITKDGTLWRYIKS